MNNGEFFLSDAIEAIEEVLASGGEFQLYPKGTSMRPLLVQERDSVVLRRNSNIPAKKHDIVFYRRTNGQFVLHRVMQIEKDGTYTMCGDNQTRFEFGIRRDQIIAYVSAIYRKGKWVKMENTAHLMYVFWWTKMPVRKAVFLFKRIICKVVRIFKGIFCKHS